VRGLALVWVWAKDRALELALEGSWLGASRRGSVPRGVRRCARVPTERGRRAAEGTAGERVASKV